MTKGLGYYGASDETNRKLDYDGILPRFSDSTKQKIVEAISEDYPEIKNCNDRDKKAIIKWVINEGQ